MIGHIQGKILFLNLTPLVFDEVQPAKQGEKYVNLSEPHTGLIRDRGQLQFLLHVEIKEFPPIVL